MNNMILYHGSSFIIDEPNLESGNIHNDYGRGFYCTTEIELAKEWACKNGDNGFINIYTLDVTGLRILNLSDGRHTVLNWIAMLLKNRIFRLESEISNDAKEYLIKYFSVETSIYDVIIGYRADDSYFQYAESFIENGLSIRGLNRALRLGNLGLQTVLISEKAFKQLKYESSEPIDNKIYYQKFMDRDSSARREYKEEVARDKSYNDDIFVLDILREEMRNDDPRIQRYLS